MIHSSGSDLLLLINDILDLSRVEAGKLEIHPEQCAIASLAEDLRTVFEPLAAEKRLDFAVSVGSGVPAEIFTDRQRLRQVLHNLLSNAVKFTQHGQVALQIGLTSPYAPGEQAAMVFSVTDTGIGISDDSLKTIFEAFQQGDGTTSRRYGGTGLGLAISREVAAQLGGQITARSQPGSGSTFTLYLPVSYQGGPDATVTPALPANPAAAAPPRRRPARVPPRSQPRPRPAAPRWRPGRLAGPGRTNGCAARKS